MQLVFLPLPTLQLQYFTSVPVAMLTRYFRYVVKVAKPLVLQHCRYSVINDDVGFVHFVIDASNEQGRSEILYLFF